MALSFPKRLERTYLDVNKRYFNSGLPLDVEFRVVEDWGEGRAIDTRNTLACVYAREEGGFVVEIMASLEPLRCFHILTIAHEAVHIRIGLEKDHRSKEWKAEVRRLTGLGLFQREF